MFESLYQGYNVYSKVEDLHILMPQTLLDLYKLHSHVYHLDTEIHKSLHISALFRGPEVHMNPIGTKILMI